MKNLKAYRLVWLLLLIVVMLPFVGQSQISDTICISKKDAIKLLTKAEEGKVLGEKVTLLNEQIFLLGQRITEKEQMIAAYEQINNANDSLISSYKKEIDIMEEQRKLFEKALTNYQKEVRRGKRKLFWTRAGGTALLGAAAYLYITK